MYVTCTKGKDGKNYYFAKGRRISEIKAKQLGAPECKHKSKVISRKMSINLEKKEKDSSVHIWLLKETLIPVDRHLLIPYREVGSYPKDSKKLVKQYGKNFLIAVDAKMNDALLSFESQRLGWNQEQWDAFMNGIYPYWISIFKGLTAKGNIGKGN